MIQAEYIHEEPFRCEAGGTIDNLRIVYHISMPGGGPSKVIWICHALTANSDPEEWWPEMVGPGRLIDTDRYTVVCANMLCSAYGSSGPAQGRFLDFPKVTVRDIVRTEALLRRHLGIGRIDLLIGSSIGGFQALEWTVMEPDVIARAAIMACGPRVTPWLTASNEAQRMAVEADPTFRECRTLKGGAAGLRTARAIALISYRSYQGYNSTQAEPDEDTLFAERAASYERYQGRKLSDRFDAYSYWYLTHSVDSHNIGRGRGGVEAALRSIRARCVIVGIDSDALFPTQEQKFMARNLPGAEYPEITSAFGHDGFLLEYRQLSAVLGPVLEKINQ